MAKKAEYALAEEKKSKSIKKANGPGGARPGAGRKKGSVGKVTAMIREIAQLHGDDAIGCLVDIMRNSENDSARVAASREVLDRAYGKSVQTVDGDLHLSISKHEQALDELE